MLRVLVTLAACWAAWAPLAAATQRPEQDSLVLLGALKAPGISAARSPAPGVRPVQGVVRFEVSGPQPLCYEVDVNDPDVRRGYARIFERESGSYPLFDGGMSYRDLSGSERHTAWLAQRCTFVGAWSNREDMLYIDYEDNVAAGPGGGGGVHHRRHVYRLVGRVMQVEVIDLDQSVQGDGNYAGFFYGTTQGMTNLQPLSMQGALGFPLYSFDGAGGSRWFWSNCVDLCQSHATRWFIGNVGGSSLNWGMNTFERYKKNSAGLLHAPVHDTVQVCVSQRVRDCFVVPDTAGSPYRDFVSRRAVVLFDGGYDQWNRYVTLFDHFASWGLTNLVGYVFHGWSSSTPECGIENRGPDWFPAKQEAQWISAAAKAREVGLSFGSAMRFSGVSPATTPVVHVDPFDYAKDANGTPKTEVQSCSPYAPFPELGTAAQARHSQREHLAVRQAYDHSCAYIDAMTYATPSGGAYGDYIDQTAGSPHAQSLKDAVAAQKSWFDEARRIVGGPLLGEGSVSSAGSNTEWIWGAYVDSVQRVINTGAQQIAQNIPANSPLAITAWPVIPEYELWATKPSQANHGNGFFNRFFGPVDGPQFVGANGLHHTPIRDVMHDRYRIYEITYGHTPFIVANGWGDGNNGGNFLRLPQMIQEYYQLLELSRRYLGKPIQAIRYRQQGALRTFEDIFAQSGSTQSFVDPQLHLDYGTLDIYLNHSSTPWALNGVGGVDYVIPEDGWVAFDSSDGFVCFSAAPLAIGQRIDYCLAPGRYELFHGRGSVAGYGGIVTGSPGALGLLQVRNFVSGAVVHEKLQTQLPSGFWTSSWEVVPAAVPNPVVSLELLLDQRAIDRRGWAGVQAIARFQNGAWDDVTMRVDWQSSNSAVASVEDCGTIRGRGVPALVQISCSPFNGVSAAPATLELR